MNSPILQENKFSFVPENYWVLLLVVTASLFLDLLFFAYTLEDAQITFRYSLRLSEGYQFGMWNRSGAPIEGFTSFLWMIYLSLYGPNLDSIVYASKITTIFSHLSISIIFFILHRKIGSKELPRLNIFLGYEEIASKAFLYSTIAISFFLPLSWYSTTGMEATLFIALIVQAIFLPLLTSNILILSIVFILLVLIRPEGIMFAFSAALYYSLVSKDRKYLALAAISLAAFISLSVFRYNYFGYFMPNTYYAKTVNSVDLMHLKHGIQYFRSFVLSYFYLFIPILTMVIVIIRSKKLSEHKPFILIVMGIIIYFMLMARTGADNMYAFPMWRHALNIIPLILFCSFFSINYLTHCYAKSISIFTVMLLVVMPLLVSMPTYHAVFLKNQLFSSLKKFPDITNEYRNNPMLLWLKSITTEETTIATSLAGALPLTVDAYHIDILGLNDEFIAHNGEFQKNGTVDSKTDMNYVLSQRPDIIEGYMKADSLLKGKNIGLAISARKKMNVDLIKNPIFQKEYYMISNAPYESFNRILFIHKEYYEKQKSKWGINVISVDQLISEIM